MMTRLMRWLGVRPLVDGEHEPAPVIRRAAAVEAAAVEAEARAHRVADHLRRPHRPYRADPVIATIRGERRGEPFDA